MSIAIPCGIVIFPTSIGWCGLTWTPLGIDQLWLAAVDRAEVERRLGHRPPPGLGADGPHSAIQALVSRITAHWEGRLDRLDDVAVDLSGCSPFARKVYETARQVGPGMVVTYGELAIRSGFPGAARAVGRAMAVNPVPLLVPCHRVVGAGGRLVGFSGPGGISLKARLLAIEGVRLGRVGSITGERAEPPVKGGR
ncbi:MAG: methylated-DNA--[protein]-cysteine S-methyltransferase [Bradymonadales bacterium]|nr:methylated-DNA--[protein]-cysteine S-methyltransferase [Bradymonadales bacterium]